MKIGITCEKLILPNNIRIYANGLHFNVLLWYSFFEKCGYEVVFLSHCDEIGIITYKDHSYNIVNPYVKKNDNEYIDENLIKSYELDCLFLAGFRDLGLQIVCKVYNIYTVYLMMGNHYIGDIEIVLYNKDMERSMKTIKETCDIDEIWISPHFSYSLEYYKICYQKDNIHIGPYIWSDIVIKGTQAASYNKGNKLKVGICEPNFSFIKNCMIPLCICEKGEQYIETVRCYNTENLRNNNYFVNFASNLKIHKEGRALFNDRFKMNDILDTCNCVISTTQECDLNYVFLECFYLGIPLIHNSKMLEEYGYYYPGLDINKAVEQIERVVEGHDTKLYIEKHKPLLEKYSIRNTYYREWVNQRLSKHDKKLISSKNNIANNDK